MWDKSTFIPLYKRRHDSDPSGNSRCNYSTDDSPLVVVVVVGGYKGNVKSVTLAAPVLTWGSPALPRSRAYLVSGGIQEGLV